MAWDGAIEGFLGFQDAHLRDDVYVFLSQSGETADTILATRYCLEKDAPCVCVINIPCSTILREVQNPHQRRTKIGVASNKAHTSQYLPLIMGVLRLLGDEISLAERQNRVIDGLHELLSQITRVTESDKLLQRSAKKMLVNNKSLLIMGRGCLPDTEDQSHERHPGRRAQARPSWAD